MDKTVNKLTLESAEAVDARNRALQYDAIAIANVVKLANAVANRHPPHTPLETWKLLRRWED